MESNYLKTLIEVVRTGSITKAAESLCVTQSAISRRIKFIETQYGYELLDRSGPVLKATAQGRIVLEKAEKIIELEQDLHNALNEKETKPEITFVCTPTFGIVHLPKIMHEFLLLSPEDSNLRFIFKMPEEIVSGMKEGLFDMAVLEHCNCFDLSDFKTTSLVGDEMLFAAAASIGFKNEKLKVEDILRQVFYGRPEGCCSRTMLEQNLNSLNHTTQDFSRVVINDDIHIILNALLKGMGIGFISSDLIEQYSKDGMLKSYRVDGFAHSRKRTLVLSGDEAGDCPAQEFVKIIETYFKSS